MKSRYIIMCVSALLLMALLFFYLSNNPGENLNEQQKKKAINIALNNPYVKEKITATGWPEEKPVTYCIGEVAIGEFREVSPGIDTIRKLPAVEIITDNQTGSGVNLYAYVDIERERVAYIGFISRIPNETGQPSEKKYENVTIVDTGYVIDQNLTESEKEKSTSIALNNSTVIQYLDDYNYEITNVGYMQEETGYPYRYIIVYPNVQIRLNKADAIKGYINVIVDPHHYRIVEIRRDVSI